MQRTQDDLIKYEDHKDEIKLLKETIESIGEVIEHYTYHESEHPMLDEVLKIIEKTLNKK